MASRAKQRIEKAARERGYVVESATYETPVELEMGDGLGGWFVLLSSDNGFLHAGGGNVDGVVEDILSLPDLSVCPNCKVTHTDPSQCPWRV